MKPAFQTLQEVWKFLSEESPEATPPDNVFGNWLAPNERGLPDEEENTPEEQEVVDALVQFMGVGNNPALLSQNNGKIAKELLDLMKKHQYEPVLNPGVPNAYRGLSFKDFNHFKKIVQSYGNNLGGLTVIGAEDPSPRQITLDELLKMPDDSGISEIQGWIKPFTLQIDAGRLVQSWTSSKDVALDFANKFGYGGMVIQTTLSKNQFFGKPGEIGKIGGFANEMETISVGPVQTDGAKFAYGFSSPIDFLK